MTGVEPLDICLLSKQFPPGVGGAETYAYELANGLGGQGHRVDVYTQWIDDSDETVDVHENVTVHRITKARKKLVTFETLYFSYKARRTIDFDQYDIVHGTLMPASTVAVTAFNDIDAQVVLTSHGTSLGETKAVTLETPADYLLKFFFHPMNVVMDYIAGRDADEVIAISGHAYNQLTTYYGLDEHNVEMIPHGVDTEWFHPREKLHPDVNSEKMTLLYVGRLGARKGLDMLLRSLSCLENPDIELLIAGTGRHEERLRRLSNELRIADQVRFLGYVPNDELPELYSSADIFILPSRYEGFGLVLLEAMACGTPVIGTDAGGIPTAIADGRTGIVVERDAQDLSSAIELLVSDQTRRDRMAETAYNRANKTSWNAIISDVKRVYDQIVP